MNKYIVIGDLDDIKTYNEIEKEQLINVLKGRVQWLLNVVDGTYFDAKTNAWRPFSESSNY